MFIAASGESGGLVHFFLGLAPEVKENSRKCVRNRLGLWFCPVEAQAGEMKAC